MRRGSVLAISMVMVTVAVAMLAARPDAPLVPPTVDDPSSGSARLALVWLSFAAMAAACAVFVWAVVAAGRGHLAGSLVLAVSVVLHGVVLLGPVLLSRDVYSYAMYGRMVSEHGLNPYLTSPSALIGDPFLSVASPAWVEEPSVYGPAFTLLSAGVTRLIQTPSGVVEAFRITAAIASVASVSLSMAAARRLAPGRVALAGVLVGWNPVVLFHTVGGGHNDALAGAAVAGALVLASAARARWATASAALGSLVKATAAVPLLIVGAAGVLARRTGHRIREALFQVGVVLTVAVPLATPFLQTEDPTLGLFSAAARRGWMAPSRLVERALGGVGVDPGAVVRIVFGLVALWAVVLVLRGLRSGALNVGAAVGYAALAALLAGPLLLPWYLPVVLAAAWALPRISRNAVVGMSVLLSITMVVAERARAPGAWDVMLAAVRYVAAPAALGLLVAVLLDLRRRARAAASDEVPGSSDQRSADGGHGPGQADPRRVHDRAGQDQGGGTESRRQGPPGQAG